jgi:hypothetical protein
VFLPPVAPLMMNGVTASQAAAVALLVMLAVLLSVNRRLQWLAGPVVAAVACWAVPNLAQTVNYPALHTAELDQLSEWARTHTSDQALFVFPASGRSLDQGVFRVKALRSLYADWKAGGQVNYFRDFALEWRVRWSELSSGRLTLADWRARGVDYLIYPVQSAARDDLAKPIYENARYRVYAIAN